MHQRRDVDDVESEVFGTAIDGLGVYRGGVHASFDGAQ